MEKLERDVTRRALVWSFPVSLFGIAGCSRRQSTGRLVEAYVPDDASVGFDLEPLQSGDSSLIRWDCIYASQAKTARFRIEFGPARVSTAKSAKDFDLKYGEGRFVPGEGSDASVLMVALQRALQAKALPTAPATKMVVPFTFASIGENLSQAADGGFNATPTGNWMAIKIFLGRGDQEGEVFLNINPKIRKGQFSIKDPDYGDLVLGELAKVL